MNLISKEAAYRKLPDEIDIPVVREGYDFKFTKKWFRNRNQSTWSTFIGRRFPGNTPVNAIQIGVFEGMDLIWLLQNSLKHPDSRVLAIDPWVALEKQDDEWMEGCYERAHHNLQSWIREGKVKTLRAMSQDVLPLLKDVKAWIGDRPIFSGNWDLIIIDGDHKAQPVYEDACNALPLLHPGGWMVFDDVRTKHQRRGEVPDGIERFLKEHKDEVKLEWQHRHCDCYSKR